MNLPQFSIRRPVAISMVFFIFLTLGVFALFRLPVELKPNVEVGNISIDLQIRGGISPLEVEDRVAKPMEEALGVIDGLEDIITISEEGECQVILYFKPEINLDYAVVEVREHYAQVQEKLPKEVERPVIAKYEYSQVPVVILAVTSDIRTVEEMRNWAEYKMKNRFARIDGVAKVDVGGGREEKIFVELNEFALRSYGLSIDDVIQILNMNNLNLVAGDVKKGGTSTYLVRTVGQFNSLEDIKNLPINPSGESHIIRVGDIAKVGVSYLDPQALSRVNSQPSISLYVQKSSGANTIKVVAGVEKEIGRLKKELPKDINIRPYFNHAQYIKQAIAAVQSSLYLGAFLTVLILWLFLRNLKYTLIISLTIPFSVIAAFSLMYLSKISINVVTLSGIALGIGMLVDSSIVVLENIFKEREVLLGSNLQLDARSLKSTAEKGATEVFLAINASTLTTIVVFFPLFFVNKEIQRLYSGLAWTVVFSLLTSLFFSFTLVPLLASRIYIKVKKKESGIPAAKDIGNETQAINSAQEQSSLMTSSNGGDNSIDKESFLSQSQQYTDKASKLFNGLGNYKNLNFSFLRGFLRGRSPLKVHKLVKRSETNLLFYFIKHLHFHKFSKFYENCVRFSLKNRYLFIGVTFVLFIFAVVQLSKLGREFIGIAEQDRFTVYVQMPSGTKIEISDDVVKKVEAVLDSIPEIKDHTSRIKGWSSEVYVEMKLYSPHSRTMDQVIEEIRQKTQGMDPAFIYCQQPETVGRREIMVEVFGPDQDVLKNLANEVGARIQGIGKFKDVKLRMRAGRPEIHIFFDKNKLALHGLTVLDVANILHAKMRGLIATRFHTSSEGVMVKANIVSRDKLPTFEEYGRKELFKDLKKLSLAMGGRESLGAGESREVETITRLEKSFRDTLDDLYNLSLKGTNGEFAYLQQVADIKSGLGPAEIWRKNKERMVQVSADTGMLSLSQSAELVNKAFRGMDFPKDYHYSFGGDYDKMLRNQEELILALLLAFFLVFLVLASMFESFVQPFIVLTTVPLAAIGVGFGLSWANEPIGLGVYIGVVILIGVVVNNAIILIDHINLLRCVGVYKESKGEVHAASEAVVISSLWRLRPILMTSLTTIVSTAPLIFQKGGTASLWRPLAITFAGGMTTATFLTLFIIPAVYLIVEDIGRMFFPKRAKV